MKNVFFILLVVAAVAFATACSIRTSNDSANTKPLVIASDTASIKYQCPMKDQHDTCYTTAGQCPVCGMDLEKK